jgi:TonB family protein
VKKILFGPIIINACSARPLSTSTLSTAMRALPTLLASLTIALGSSLFAQSPTERIVPKSVRNTAPIYPYELLIQGKEGSAEVQFTIEYSGKAILASVVTATDPAFAKALLADIEANEFLPPRINGQPKLAQAQLRYSFNSSAGLDVAARQILAELRKPMPAIPLADQLDKKATPVRQDQPIYPYSLLSDGVSGHAEIEVVIDRTGRVLFPRIVSATNEDVGYAAAAAVARWRYQPGQKGGQPVDSRLTVTINYDQAKMAASW